jgi:16S rRNA (guanine527-N7)-methyltransferase
VLHSLAIATQFNFPDEYEIMDLGTGGGFPGIPLAIFFPNVRFHLVDSINKKLKVVEAISNEIGLKNVTVQHTRVEDIKDKKFDIVVSRAVSSIKDLWFWSKPLLKKKPINQPKKINGLICLKGGNLSQEIAESGCHPRIWEIDTIFDEVFFKEKYILLIPS